MTCGGTAGSDRAADAAGTTDDQDPAHGVHCTNAFTKCPSFRCRAASNPGNDSGSELSGTRWVKMRP